MKKLLPIVLYILILLSVIVSESIFSSKESVQLSQCSIHGSAVFLLALFFAGGLVYRSQNHQPNSGIQKK